MDVIGLWGLILAIVAIFLSLGTPNCHGYLHAMQPIEVRGHLFWKCPACGAAKLA